MLHRRREQRRRWPRGGFGWLADEELEFGGREAGGPKGGGGEGAEGEGGGRDGGGGEGGLGASPRAVTPFDQPIDSTVFVKGSGGEENRAYVRSEIWL